MVRFRRQTSVWRRAAAVATLVLLAGCGELIPLADRTVQRGDVSLRPLLDSDSLAVPGKDSSDVTGALGEPERTDSDKPPRDERPGDVITLHYDGLDVVVHELRKPRRTFISDLVISSSTYEMDLPIAVGASRDDIERALGPPASSQGDASTYQLTDAGDRCVVTYDGDRATELALHYGWT